LGIDIDEAPAGTRASMNGQVPEKTTYNDWLKGQPAKVQDDILGPGRGKLFRNDGYSVSNFVDRKTGRHYTLKELAADDGIQVVKKVELPGFNKWPGEESVFKTSTNEIHDRTSELLTKGVPIDDSMDINFQLKKYVENNLKNELLKLKPEDREAYDYFLKNILEKTSIERGILPEKELIHGWAESSAGNKPMSLFLQHMAKEEFGLSSSTTSHFSKEAEEVLSNILKKLDQEKARKGAKIFLRTMYSDTQAMFAEEGITELELFRGQVLPKTDLSILNKMQKEKVTMQPMSSFSTSLRTAKEFASQEIRDSSFMSTTIGVKVPIERIIACPKTGFGCYGEFEFIVLGGDDFVVFVNTKNGVNPSDFVRGLTHFLQEG
jgi:hypothetical protein